MSWERYLILFSQIAISKWVLKEKINGLRKVHFHAYAIKFLAVCQQIVRSNSGFFFKKWIKSNFVLRTFLYPFKPVGISLNSKSTLLSYWFECTYYVLFGDATKMGRRRHCASFQFLLNCMSLQNWKWLFLQNSSSCIVCFQVRKEGLTSDHLSWLPKVPFEKTKKE